MSSEATRPQAETRTITIKGQRLRIAIRPGDGTRTPLLLMNGIGINFEALQPFVDALAPAIEVIRFDVPGTGSSPAPRIPQRFSAHARLVTQMLDQLSYQQVDVLGVSWGGGLAQQFAFQYPDRCRRLILVSTGTGALMVPGHPSVLAKMATPRRYQDPSYMLQITGELYGGKVRTQPELERRSSNGELTRRGSRWLAQEKRRREQSHATALVATASGIVRERRTGDQAYSQSQTLRVFAEVSS